MKKIVFAPAFFFAAFSVALADWNLIFLNLLEEKGMNQAVVYALSEGNSPDKIMKIALPVEGLEAEKLIKAMFCAFVPQAAIYEAAEINSVADEKVTAGYELALEECPEAMAENTGAAAHLNPTLSPGGGTSSSHFASPSTF